MSDASNWSQRLTSILQQFDCQTGTIHQSTQDGMTLDLLAQSGVPDFLLEKISSIPVGKGIAGAAAERREPVELCNLQEDLGGVAKPDAQKTGVAGSLAVPIFAESSGAVIGTLGIGKFLPYQFSDAEKNQLATCAAHLADLFQNNQACSD